MILSTGRKVIERAEPNGSTFAEIEGGETMTNAEWEEYCANIRALTLEQARARLAARRCPGMVEYGHGMNLTRVHGSCCAK